LTDGVPIRQPDDFDPLSYADVAAFGLILYGTRWRTAFAKDLGITRQMIDHWKRLKRRISPRRSREMTLAVGLQHQRKSARERAIHNAVIRNTTSRSARALLIVMLAEEIADRAEAMRMLTRNGDIHAGTAARGEDAR
jgi:hypothetical protein